MLEHFILGAIMYAFASVSFIVAGRLLYRRAPEGDVGRALRLLSLWAYLFATYGFIFIARELGGALGLIDVDGYRLATLAIGLVVSLADFAFLAYLLYMVLGHHRAQAWVAVPVMMGFVAIVRATVSHSATLEVTTWRLAMTITDGIPPWEALGLLLALSLPALCALPLLLVLRSRGLSRTQVYRVDMLVSMCAFWLMSSLLNVLVQVHPAVWVELAARACFVMMATLVLLAYAPPRFIRRRLAVTGLADDIRRATFPPAPPAGHDGGAAANAETDGWPGRA